MRLRLSNLGLPMLAKDLREMAQRRRTYGVRVAFALLTFSLCAVLFIEIYGAPRGPKGLLGQGATLLYFLYVIEWFGLCLFVPAVVSGALAAEKERNTLQLLFLTRLGPWTILLEKLLSRFVTAFSFLLVSLPVLCLAYLLGGVTRNDVTFAVLGLAATVFQVGCIALFASAFCATSSSAFVLSYLSVAFVFLFPHLTYAAVQLVRRSPPAGPGWYDWLNSTQGITDWIFFRGSLRPFHTNAEELLVIVGSGLLFLLLARLVIVRRAAPQPKHRIRRVFQGLDRVVGRVNDRFAFGFVLGGAGSDLPKDDPVAWREGRRGNLGQINYLVRVLLVLELPIVVFSVVYVATTRDFDFSGLSFLSLVLWPVALLVVVVRSAGLIAAEKARQTLDVLLATPLPLSSLVGAKMRGLWRVMAVVSVPILLHAILVGFLHASYGGSRWSYYRLQGFDVSQSAWYYVTVATLNLVVLLALAAQLAFLFGLPAKTQGRAVTAVLGVFVAWCFIPLIVLTLINADSWVLYLSPISGLLANEVPEFNDEWWRRQTETGHSGFYMLIHCGIYASIAATLAWVNHLLARRVLLRPSRPGSPQILNAP
jgi:ABC-type transport system involved in multi-copper enzyme maturation permease subunit